MQNFVRVCCSLKDCFMTEQAYKNNEVVDLKVPPNSIEAEQAVLGGLLIDTDSWDQIADVVSETDFYRHDHGRIFSAIKDLAEIKDHPHDVVTVSEWFENRKELDDVGGMLYIASLAKDTPTAANIKAYASIVRERSVMRQLIRIGTDISDSAYNPEGRESKELLEFAESSIFKIAEQGSREKNGFVGINDLLKTTVDKIEQLYEQDGSLTGLSTGFSDYDDMTSGLQPGELVIVAARPSMGKTTFAMNMAENVAIASGKAVAIFSMEMPGDSLVLRMMSSLGRIDQNKVRSGKLDDEDWPRLTSAIGLLSQAKIFIDDTGGLSPGEMRARARRLKREHDIGLIVIDYLQLMQIPGSKENRTGEISEISRSLKALAKELSVPVIALSQLNRSLEQRPDKRPIMSDLRESGAIEQDADVIVFIYRDEYYNEDSEYKGTAEIIIGKQRNGPTGKVRLTFLGQYTKFENYISDVYSDGGFSE